MHRGKPAEVNVVSEGEGHVGIGSGTGRQKKKKKMNFVVISPCFATFMNVVIPKYQEV